MLQDGYLEDDEYLIVEYDTDHHTLETQIPLEDLAPLVHTDFPRDRLYIGIDEHTAVRRTMFGGAKIKATFQYLPPDEDEIVEETQTATFHRGTWRRIRNIILEETEHSSVLDDVVSP